MRPLTAARQKNSHVPGRFTSCFVVLARIHPLAAAAAGPDDSEVAAAHGLAGAKQIALSCAANPVPRFSADETAVVIMALTPDTKMREYIFVLGEASPLLIVGKLGILQIPVTPSSRRR